VLLFTGLIATLATSFSGSVRLQMEESRDYSRSLQAELAAESGFEYALRQLLLDSDWAGTGPDGLDLPAGGRFTVSCDPSAEGVDIEIDGVHGTGTVRYALSVEGGDDGSNTGTKAVICLGEEVELEHAHVHGSMLIADQYGSVMDWHNNGDGSGYWGADGRDPGEFEFEFEWAHVHETLWKFTETTYIGSGTDERVTDDPVKMPSWWLEDWLTPQAGVVVLTDVVELKNKHYSDTVVLYYTAAPPQHKDGKEWDDDVHLRNCHFDGGLVVYTPWHTDVRDPEDTLGFEIEIEADNCHFGTPHTNSLGILAPGAEVELENSIVRGLVYGYEVELDNSNMWGVLIAIHELELEHAQVFYDPDVARNPPPGVELDIPNNAWSLRAMRERFD